MVDDVGDDVFQAVVERFALAVAVMDDAGKVTGRQAAEITEPVGMILFCQCRNFRQAAILEAGYRFREALAAFQPDALGGLHMGKQFYDAWLFKLMLIGKGK